MKFAIRQITTDEGTNKIAAASVKVSCEGPDAEAALQMMNNALNQENRRRRDHGMRPIAYDIQLLSTAAEAEEE